MATTTYSTGAITVAAGSTAVTGTGTAWLTSGVRAGDMFMAAGLCVPIAAVNSATSITLARAWPGSALSGAVYDIDYRDDGTRALAAANSLLQTLGNGALTSLAALSSAANKLPYFSGANTFAQADLTPAARAILALTGAAGAKVPIVTAAGAAALRDIVGTVSQASGVPTGAIVERGSNANGEFIRMADGTQICWTTATTFTYQTTNTLVGTVTQPAAFVGNRVHIYALSNSSADWTLADICRYVGALRYAAASDTLYLTRCEGAPNFVSGNSLAGVRVTTIGRWF